MIINEKLHLFSSSGGEAETAAADARVGSTTARSKQEAKKGIGGGARASDAVLASVPPPPF